MPDEFEDVIDTAVWRRAATTRDSPVGRTRMPVVRLVLRLYAAANAPLRARMLARMLRPLSPLGMVAIAAGAFAGYLHRAGSEGLRIALDDVGGYTNEQIAELAHFVEQVSPDALVQLASLVADSPAGITAFSVSAAILLLRSLQSAPQADALATLQKSGDDPGRGA
jgi:hypothetical protein